MTEQEHLKVLIDNIRFRKEQIQLEHAKLEQEQKIIEGYGAMFQRRLDSLGKGT